MFISFVTLTEQADETMIFSKYVFCSMSVSGAMLISSSLLRLRQELAKLITRHTDQISDPVAKATAQSTVYEGLLQGLSVS